MPDCLFCKLVRGEIPSTKLFENDKTIAFLDINPVNPGHALIIPKKHATDIFDIEQTEWIAIMETAQKVAHAVEKSISPEGVNLAMNNRRGAGQVVFHAHVHVMPRQKDDGHTLWKGRPYAEGEAARTAEKIRAAL